MSLLLLSMFLFFSFSLFLFPSFSLILFSSYSLFRFFSFLRFTHTRWSNEESPYGSCFEIWSAHQVTHTTSPASITLLDFILYHVMSYHIMSYHTISYHTISYHVIPYHIVSRENQCVEELVDPLKRSCILFVELNGEQIIDLFWLFHF